MDVFDATEQAYSNGYSAGYLAGRRSVLGEQKLDNTPPSTVTHDNISSDYCRGWNDAIKAMTGKWGDVE